MTNVPVSWRKSSRSAQQTDCVEVANTLNAVRDTKNPQVTLSVDVRAFVAAVRRT